MRPEAIQRRDVLMRGIRTFFYDRNYTEVETPIRMETPCMELNIDAEPSGTHFLRTSPELFHKQLLAAGHSRIFEIGKCFRSGEFGPLHHPEYTMLEWYQADADYMDILEETKLLISKVWNGVSKDWKLLTVSEAFLEFAGWDPAGSYDEDRFDIDLVEKVEPAIKAIGGPVVLMDYPVEAAALSRRKKDHPLLAERWELYIDGIELANAYSELTDPVEQRERFEACAEQRRAMGKTVYALDEGFLHALDRMPPSGGVALGVDRLLMLIAGASSLDAVIPFRRNSM
jgi:lysyl-tRNA synthetase class 2